MVGEITEQARTDLGLPAGITVGPGTGDNMAAALGLGLRPGDVALSLGTSGTVYAVSPTSTHDASGAVAGFCDAAAFAKDARDLIRVDGLVVTGGKGELVRHPAYMIWQQSVAKVESLGKLLALNPSARLRLLAELEDPDDDEN